uniref:Initiator protein NS1 n=1 Tax=Simian bocavirus TaxID=2042693 RepID=A0A1W5PTD6_9VIRU|nr:NS1 [Simian bocavirus]
MRTSTETSTRVSAALKMALIEIASLQDLTAFHEPAYTYVLKWPRVEWRVEEATLQRLMAPNSLRELYDQYGPLRELPDITNQEQHFSYLESTGPRQSFLCVLAQAAHAAVKKEYQLKQGTRDPAYSCYVQVELGEQNLHVHIVTGGKGLNKYNAKAWRNVLSYYWLTYIKEHIISTSDVILESAEYFAIKWTLEAELHKCKASYTGICTILEYKNKNGQQYACRVDPTEFIANYLLCKNLKYSTTHAPIQVTPYKSFFVGTTKTYAITLINGKYIQPWVRKHWTDELQAHNSRNKEEPVFTGDPFGMLPKVDQANWTGAVQSRVKMTKREGLMIDCMQRCLESHLLTYEQLVGKHPDLVVMIESQPGGARLLEQILGMVHIRLCQTYTAFTYLKTLFLNFEIKNDNKVFKLLNKQGYNPWQVGHWICCVLDKKAGKQNTLCFYGPASTGKTNLAKAIVNAVKLYGCVNHLNRNFVFNDCASKLILWWEECVMHVDWVEPAKCLMGGTEFRIDRKHRDYMLLPQTPVIISTNNDIYTTTGGNTVIQVHAKPSKDRVVQFNFMNQLESTFGEITEEEVAAWLLTCGSRFNCTLQGFYSEWNLECTPNSFPLNKICDGHSQDFTLHENGICRHCGTYLPLDTDCGDLVGAEA